MPRYYKLSEEEVKQRVDYAVEICDIAKYMDTNPYEIPYPIRKFVAIAAVIASKPKYIILDEPTAGQDLHGTQVLGKMVDRLTKDGMTVITITHDMEFAVKNFDRVIAMAHKNVICDGTAQDVFWNEEVVADAKIKKPTIGELAKRLGMDGKILFSEELVEKL